AEEKSKRAPLREGNPIYARLEERIGRNLYTHESRKLAELAIRLDADPVIVADVAVSTEDMILAAIFALPPGVDRPLSYISTVIDRARRRHEMPGTNGTGKKPKVWTMSDLCDAINKGQITTCNGEKLPAGRWSYNSYWMLCDGSAFIPAKEVGGASWA